MRLERAAWVLWPSFMMAGVASGVAFSLVDPHELHLPGQPGDANPLAVYSVGFLIFWVLCAASSALSILLAGTSHSTPDDKA